MIRRVMSMNNVALVGYGAACLSQDYEWFELSGKGTLYSWTEVLFLPSQPHFIGVIELDEKIGRSIAKVEGEVEDLKIGLQMSAIYIKFKGRTILGWEPSER